MLFDGGRDKGGHVGIIGDIAAHRGRSELGGHVLHDIDAAAGDDQRRAFCRKTLHRREPESAATADDDGYLAVEPSCHRRHLLHTVVIAP